MALNLSTTTHHKLPILAVDDYGTMLRIIRNLLHQLGYVDVDGASEGGEALEMMDRKDYALIISDWNMAPVSGLELLCEMRTHTRFQATPFIMISAEAGGDYVTAACSAGASGYIPKPFNGAMLKAKLDLLLSA